MILIFTLIFHYCYVLGFIATRECSCSIICLCLCVSPVCALTFESLDLETSLLVGTYIFVISTMCLRKVPTFKLSVTLSRLNQFSKCLHCWKSYEICYKTGMKLPTSP